MKKALLKRLEALGFVMVGDGVAWHDESMSHEILISKIVKLVYKTYQDPDGKVWAKYGEPKQRVTEYLVKRDGTVIAGGSDLEEIVCWLEKYPASWKEPGLVGNHQFGGFLLKVGEK